MSTDTKAKELVEINDRFRATLRQRNLLGKVVVTPGVTALPPPDQIKLVKRVEKFKEFTPDNDPHGEHDFGKIEMDGTDYFWKIDCYDLSYERGSDDPTNLEFTRRVMTIMRADEY